MMLVAVTSAMPGYGSYDDSHEYDDDSYHGSHGYGGRRSYGGSVGYVSRSYGGHSGGYGGYSVSRPVVQRIHKVVHPVVHKRVVTGYSHGRGYGY